jgi:hypothetical protein
MGICSYHNNLPDSTIICIISTPDSITYTVCTPDNVTSTPDNIISTPDNVIITPDNIINTPNNTISTPDNIISTLDNIISTPDNIIIPKYNELNQSPPFCFYRLCIKNSIRPCKSPDIVNNKRCINKHHQNLDEYWYNNYMRQNPVS